jgi:glycosyltransferase involved in cell wall biosynthesis
MKNIFLNLVEIAKAGNRDDFDAMKNDHIINVPDHIKKATLSMMDKIWEYYSGNVLVGSRNGAIGGLIDEYGSVVREGVSLVTCCMNREENLLKALPTWTSLDGVDEIVLVDWNSKTPVHQVVKAHGLDSSKIRYLRIENQPRWVLSYAFNAGFRVSRFSKIIKCDADIKLNPNFLTENLISQGEFRTGNWRSAPKGQEHINGFFYIHREDLLAVKGFNEHITTYGWDDDDIYSRLVGHGLRRVDVAPATIWHIPHGDDKRLGHDGQTSGNYSAVSVLSKDPAHKIRANKFIAEIMPEWNPDRRFVDIKIKNVDGNVFHAEQTSESWHVVPEHIADLADYISYTKFLSWQFGGGAFWVKPENVVKLLKNISLDALSKLMIDLAVRTDPEVMLNHSPIILINIKEIDKENNKEDLYRKLSELAATKNRNLYLHRSFPEGNSPLWSLKNLSFVGEGLDFSGVTRVGFEDLHGFCLSDHVKSFDNQIVLLEMTEQELTDGFHNIKSSVDGAPAVVRRRKRLYIDAQHGLGNRLRAIASAAAVANATYRELVVVWKPDFHCEAEFCELFDNDLTVIDEINESGIKRYNYIEIESGSNKDEEIITDVSADILVRSAYVLKHKATNWNSENKFLARLRPTNYVRSLIESVPHDYVSSFHIRWEGAPGTDKNLYDHISNWTEEGHAQINLWRDKSNPKTFMKVVDELLTENSGAHFFLASDTESVYEMFLNRYGKKCMRYLPRKTFDRSRDQIIYALADAYLLSKGAQIFGSNWSSFTELASRLSNGKSAVKLAGVDFEK